MDSTILCFTPYKLAIKSMENVLSLLKIPEGERGFSLFSFKVSTIDGKRKLAWKECPHQCYFPRMFTQCLKQNYLCYLPQSFLGSDNWSLIFFKLSHLSSFMERSFIFSSLPQPYRKTRNNPNRGSPYYMLAIVLELV